MGHVLVVIKAFGSVAASDVTATTSAGLRLHSHDVHIVDSESRSGYTIDLASVKARGIWSLPHCSNRTPQLNTKHALANDTVRPKSKNAAAHDRAAGQDSSDGVSLLAHAIRYTLHQHKMQKDTQKPQQPACWYNNVCSCFTVDATLTINNKMTVDTVAATKQAELLSLISFTRLFASVDYTACLAHKLSCRAIQ